MNSPLLACIGFGLLVIVARAPFIFWPGETRIFYREQIFCSATKIRLLTIIPFLFALPLVLTTVKLQGGFAAIVISLGLIVVAGCGVLVVIPDDVKDLVTTLLNLMSDNVLRGVGVFSVAAALLWIYVSFVFFGSA